MDNQPPPSGKPNINATIIDPDDDQIRLDRWFHRHYPHLGFGHVNKLLRTGQVRVDGKRVTGQTRLLAGQTLRLPPPHVLAAPPLAAQDPEAARQFASSSRTLLHAVLYEDDNFIVINKPSGLATQGGTGIKISVDDLTPNLVPEGTAKPRLVHRLDRETSGALALAKTAKAAAFLAEQFKLRTVRKVYWAVVIGQPAKTSGEIRLALKRREGALDKVYVHASGEDAVTRYRTVSVSKNRQMAWLELEPQTGRMHQLRVHCAALGTPILGDQKYGLPTDRGSRTAGRPDGNSPGNNSGVKVVDPKMHRGLHLHARTLWLPSMNGSLHRVDAPLPTGMQKFWLHEGWPIDDAP